MVFFRSLAFFRKSTIYAGLFPKRNVSKIASSKMTSTNIGAINSMLPEVAKTRLIWLDCEMSGLDVETSHLLEVACIITEGDDDLTIVETGPDLVINQPDSVLRRMGAWCTVQHAESGLTEAVQKSTIDLAAAENELLTFVRKHTVAGVCPMAGNTVYMDKLFLMKYMPKFVDHFHYRLVDVSTVKELSRRWYPNVFDKQPTKKMSHRALGDIKESIEELRYYKKNIFSQG